MDIFTTTFEYVFEDSLNALRFKLLQKLAGANASKFDCLAPSCCGKTLSCISDHRKAEYVELCILLLNAGFDPAKLPSGCGCQDLHGSVCECIGDGFKQIVDGIGDIA